MSELEIDRPSVDSAHSEGERRSRQQFDEAEYSRNREEQMYARAAKKRKRIIIAAVVLCVVGFIVATALIIFVKPAPEKPVVVRHTLTTPTEVPHQELGNSGIEASTVVSLQDFNFPPI